MRKLFSSVIILLVLTGTSNHLFSQIVNIPDANFKALLVGNAAINTNADAEIQVSEAAAYSGTINASSQGINNLTGIEAFTSITALDCGFNNLTSLDLTYNVSLTSVNCPSNSLVTLDVSNLPYLSTLNCTINNLTCLDLHTDTSLTSLNCNSNNLNSLNLRNGHNSILTFVNCQSNFPLPCIQVDNVAAALAAGWWYDTWSTYNTACGGGASASFSSNAPVCFGTAVTFVNSSLFSNIWEWDFGDGATSNIQNPTHVYAQPGSYWVSLVAGNCNSYDTTGNTAVQGKDIWGHVTYSGSDLTSGKAIIFPDQGTYISYDTLQIQQLDISGNYHFTNIPDGNYLIKVYPSVVLYPQLVPSYYTNDWAWDSSTVFNQDCYVDGTADISMVELTAMAFGPGNAFGYVIEGAGFGRAQGDPIHGVDIKLGITGTSSIVASDTTDFNGLFTFANIGYGTYTVYADITGLERDSVYTFTVDSANTYFPNLYYVVDSVKITIIPGIGIEEESSSNISLMEVYPNPSNGNMTLRYNLNTAADVQIDVFDLLGLKVQSLVDSHLSSGEHSSSFNLLNNHLKSGIYFISISANGKAKTKRIILIE